MAKIDQSLECYAREIGGCMGRINREHYVSEGVLRCIGGPKEGNAQVYGWNLAHPKRFHGKPLDIGKLCDGILCEKHNSALNMFDAAGKAVCEAAGKPSPVTDGQSPIAEIPQVNGDDFERWMLKTLCGSLYSGRVWEQLANWRGVEPPIEWLEILYKGSKIPDPQGIYWQPTECEEYPEEVRRDLNFRPIFSKDLNAFVGIQAWFYGLRFDLVLHGNPTAVSALYKPDVYRPSVIVPVGCGAKLRFRWKDGRNFPLIIETPPSESFHRGTTPGRRTNRRKRRPL